MKQALISLVSTVAGNSKRKEVVDAILNPLEDVKLHSQQSEGYRLSRYLGRMLRTDLSTDKIHTIIREYARGNR